jgi:hypothetical protein
VSLEKALEKVPVVVVPTDKTNSFRVISTEDYTRFMNEHLATSSVEVPRKRILEIHLQAQQEFECLLNDGLLNENELRFIEENLKGKAIPTPSLLIKDHKKPLEDGNFPTRLVIPADNFTSAFPKLGYKGIKKIFDDREVKYATRTIINAQGLKEALEKLDIFENEVTIASLDVESMYPSTRFKLIQKAVTHFSKGLPRDVRDRVKRCLSLIKFGMGHSLCMFRGRYFEYNGLNGDIDPNERALTIGGFESAWLADLVASYILDVTNHRFRRTTVYAGIYRDDGLLVFRGKRTVAEIHRWWQSLQHEINEIAEGSYFQVKMVLWEPGGPERRTIDGVSTFNGQAFPYLDMEMFWNRSGALNFKVHLKDNQRLQYLNRGSTHTRAVFAAIPHGVLGRLARLTSITDETKDLRLDQLYPEHAKALRQARITPDRYPTLQEMTDEIRQSTSKSRKRQAKEKQRQVYFCLGVSGWHVKPVHTILKRLRNQFNLKWLRISMSYHRFANLRQMYQRDKEKKLMNGIHCGDCVDRPCNCSKASQVNGECPFGGKCRQHFLVYEATCQACNQIYIGNTQQTLKVRFRQHCNDTVSLVRGKITAADTLARHLASHIPSKTASACDVRALFRVKVKWKGNPFGVMKTFRTYSCQLCVNEKVDILRCSEAGEKGRVMNSRLKWDEACPHVAHFHRFTFCAGTDEDVNPEKVTDDFSEGETEVSSVSSGQTLLGSRLV